MSLNNFRGFWEWQQNSWLTVIGKELKNSFLTAVKMDFTGIS